MKILVFMPNWLGDVIFTTPVFEALKSNSENARVECVVPPRCKDVLVHNPFIDGIIEFNERQQDRFLWRQLRLATTLKSRRYDTVFLLHRSFTRTLLCALAGIPKRVGYDYPQRSFLLTQKVPAPDKDSFHKQDYYLGVVRAVIPVTDTNCKVYSSDREKEWAASIIEKHGRNASTLIALNPLTNWPPKNWPLEYFDRCIRIIKGRRPGVIFFLTSQKDDDRFRSLAENHRDCLVNLAGQTSLRELAALYGRMDLVISGDSGPLHLAGAVGAKYVGLYGSTHPRLSGIRTQTPGKIIFKNDSCLLPCYYEESCPKNFSCMQDISPEEVAEAAFMLLQRSGGRSPRGHPVEL